MKALQRIAIICTPTFLDGITVLAIFITIFATILIPHLLMERKADQLQAQNLAKKGGR
jgi:hypothetical protein